MPLTDTEIARALAPAGLLFIERYPGEVHLPLKPGRSAASSDTEDGRFDAEPEEFVDVDDPDFTAKINAGWLRLALAFGLFDERREFLLGIEYSEDPFGSGPVHAWARVRLLADWDLAGNEVSLLRNSPVDDVPDQMRFVPEFTVLSLDQRVLMSTTFWGNWTVSTIVICPDRLEG